RDTEDGEDAGMGEHGCVRGGVGSRAGEVWPAAPSGPATHLGAAPALPGGSVGAGSAGLLRGKLGDAATATWGVADDHGEPGSVRWDADLTRPHSKHDGCGALCRSHHGEMVGPGKGALAVAATGKPISLTAQG